MLYAAIRSMGRKKEKTINLTELEPEEKLKYEIAEELGLLDRVMQDGWKSLTQKRQDGLAEWSPEEDER